MPILIRLLMGARRLWLTAAKSRHASQSIFLCIFLSWIGKVTVVQTCVEGQLGLYCCIMYIAGQDQLTPALTSLHKYEKSFKVQTRPGGRLRWTHFLLRENKERSPSRIYFKHAIINILSYLTFGLAAFIIARP